MGETDDGIYDWMLLNKGAEVSLSVYISYETTFTNTKTTLNRPVKVDVKLEKNNNLN